MKQEVWLRANRRALLFSALPALSLFGIGLWLVLGADASVIGGCCLVLGAVLVTAIAISAARPRLARRDKQLVVYLTAGQPETVPLEVVECFFMGSGSAPLVGNESNRSQARTANIIVRLAESAHQWKELDVQPRLGRWSDGYITIRGAWCEPISTELISGLNERLKAAHRDLRSAGQGVVE